MRGKKYFINNLVNLCFYIPKYHLSYFYIYTMLSYCINLVIINKTFYIKCIFEIC